jgi:hypothetical protein
MTAIVLPLPEREWFRPSKGTTRNDEGAATLGGSDGVHENGSDFCCCFIERVSRPAVTVQE